MKVAENGSIALMQVIGRGTCKVAVGFRHWIDEIVSSPTVKSVMLDLSSCSSLDSTFMGLMVTLAIQSRRRFSLLVLNATPEHHELLDGIGVTKVWRYVEQPIPSLTWSELESAAVGSQSMDGASKSVIIEAHEALMDLDEANIPKFRDVVELLKGE